MFQQKPQGTIIFSLLKIKINLLTIVNFVCFKWLVILICSFVVVRHLMHTLHVVQLSFYKYYYVKL